MARGRRPSVRYWDSRGTWIDDKGVSHRGAYCCTIDGQQYVLAAGPDDGPKGPNYIAAQTAFTDLLALSSAGTAGNRNSCRVVIECYLQNLEEEGSPNSYRMRQRALAAFCKTSMGDWPVAKLTPFAVEKWLREMRKERTIKAKKKNGVPGTVTRKYRWGAGSIRIAQASLQAAFNYAVKKKIITSNPIKGMEETPGRSRSRDCIVGPEDHRIILSQTRGQFREICICLENTGCRPGELLRATATDWHDGLGALVYYGESRRREGEGKHKTRKKNKDRRIFFTGEALKIMRARVSRYPQGPLWRASQGPERPLTEAALVDHFTSLRAKVGLPKLTAYSYRHTYATNYLEKGGSIDDLAALMGNTPEVLRRHYTHLVDNLDRMRKLAEKFSAARADTPPTVLPFGEAEAAG